MSESATFQVEKSYEAVTLDYLSPLWYSVGEPFATEEAAQAEVSRLYKENEGKEPIAYRYSRVVPQAEVDAFLEAEFAANKQFWADQARVVREAEEAARATYALKGQQVTVVKGRKVPVGTTGEVFWVGQSKYGGFRVGLKDAEGETHWTAAANVQSMSEAAV